MSLPWKKPKTSRISRFMSEFQQSPRHGGSLVVETGFPTSLIDLFFKNRDRLKKSSSKRVKRQTQTAPNAISSVNPNVVLEKLTKRETVRSKNEISGVLAAENKHTSEKSVCGDGESGAFVLMAFKVLIVALLAFSTKKKLTIGITLSALALLLTELVAARVLTRVKLCDADVRKETPVDKNAISCGKIETFDDSSDDTKSISCTEKTEPEAITIRDILLKDEKSTSKSSRLKSKIVKKLRSYQKKKKKTIMIKEESLTEVTSLVVSEDKSERIESKRDEERLNPPLLIESKGDQTNGIVLIVIVLVGLLSGKLLAIVLTLSCLVLRFGAAKKI